MNDRNTSRFGSIGAWISRNRRAIALFGWPLVAFETFNWCYDHLFFGIAIVLWGPIWGGIIPVLGAFAINALVFWLYDHMKVDWLKAKLASELADKENKTQFERLITWHRQERKTVSSKLRGIAIFISLTSVIDPVILAVYCRENYFKGVSLRDWFVLFAATVSACFLWVMLWEGGIYILEFLYRQFAPLLAGLA